jgi:hypothetical protein
MEEQAEYQASPGPADRRELVAPVAAWLAGLRFRILGCGPVAGTQQADVVATWRSPAGAIFLLELRAELGHAWCCLLRVVGGRARTCFAWTLVDSAQEVRWLLERNYYYQQASAAASAPLEAARGRGRPGL